MKSAATAFLTSFVSRAGQRVSSKSVSALRVAQQSSLARQVALAAGVNIAMFLASRKLNCEGEEIKTAETTPKAQQETLEKSRSSMKNLQKVSKQAIYLISIWSTDLPSTVALNSTSFAAQWTLKKDKSTP